MMTVGPGVCRLHFPAFLARWLPVTFCQEEAQQEIRRWNMGKLLCFTSFTLCVWHPGEWLCPLQNLRASCSSPPFSRPHVSLLWSSDNTTLTLYATSSRTSSHFLQLGISDLILRSPFCSSSFYTCVNISP